MCKCAAQTLLPVSLGEGRRPEPMLRQAWARTFCGVVKRRPGQTCVAQHGDVLRDVRAALCARARGAAAMKPSETHLQRQVDTLLASLEGALESDGVTPTPIVPPPLLTAGPSSAIAVSSTAAPSQPSPCRPARSSRRAESARRRSRCRPCRRRARPTRSPSSSSRRSSTLLPQSQHPACRTTLRPTSRGSVPSARAANWFDKPPPVHRLSARATAGRSPATTSSRAMCAARASRRQSTW